MTKESRVTKRVAKKEESPSQQCHCTKMKKKEEKTKKEKRKSTGRKKYTETLLF